jgi:hypothetical protein
MALMLLNMSNVDGCICIICHCFVLSLRDCRVGARISCQGPFFGIASLVGVNRMVWLWVELVSGGRIVQHLSTIWLPIKHRSLILGAKKMWTAMPFPILILDLVVKLLTFLDLARCTALSSVFRNVMSSANLRIVIVYTSDISYSFFYFCCITLKVVFVLIFVDKVVCLCEPSGRFEGFQCSDLFLCPGIRS